jgi:hypothetical protein
VVARLDPQTWWWLARASGIVAWILVVVAMLWGLTLSARLIRRKGTPAWLLDLHRYFGSLTLAFTGIHLLALWADSYVTFGPRELFVPFASPWRTRAVAWGILALYLLVAVQTTSWVMRRLSRPLWHSIHLTSFLLLASATVHGALAGADRTNIAFQWIALVGLCVVVFLVAFRVLVFKRDRRSITPLGAEERAARIEALRSRSKISA